MRNYAILFLGCLLFHLSGTWSLPLIDRDEPRFAEASREMIEHGDYVVPFFNNQYRFDKPPLTYWFQVASYRIFGENDFAARFPTAVAASLVALVLFAWGSRLRNKRAGWWAATVFTLALQTFVHGKAAVADMWLVLFVTLANRAAYELITAQPNPRKWWWIFYVALSLAFLAKGPIGWTPLLTVAIAKLFYPAAPFRTRFRFIPGILVTLAIVCMWGVPALIRTHGEFFNVGIGKHVIGRSVATMEGHGAASPFMYFALLPFYFLTVFVSFLPWSIKLPALWKQLRIHHNETDRFLIAGALVIFVIFTLVRTKLPHYTLPAFPLLALVFATRFEQLRLSRVLVFSTLIVYLLIALLFPPAAAKFFPSYTLARTSKEHLVPGMEFGAVDYNEPSLVWYFRKNIRGFMTTVKRRDAADYMSRPGPRFIVLPTSAIYDTFPKHDPGWRSYRTEGFNVAKGQRVDLTLLLKPQ